MSHIKSIQSELAWCGEQINTDLHYFKSIDQASLTGIFETPVTPCPDCINECVTSLLNSIKRGSQ